MNRDPRDGVAEMALGVEGLPLCVLGPGGDYRRAFGDGYGPVQEARALDTMAAACEVVDAKENADAAMEATLKTYAWRLCWATPVFGAIATEPIDWTRWPEPGDRLMREARALATCLRETVSVQYRRHGGGWALWDIARPIETCGGGAE